MWSALPRWARLGLIALAAVVVALLVLVVVRVITRNPPIPLGVTSVAELRPGSCVAEAALDRDEYTVVSCADEHPMQVFATADINIEEVIYREANAVLGAFASSVCDRYLEYRLFLQPDFEKLPYEAVAIAVPTTDEYEAGDTDALCVIRKESGEPLTGDLYRAMP